MTPWRVIAFHTDDDIYNTCIAALRQSLEEFCIPHTIECIPSLSSWKDTTLSMSTHILNAFDRHDCNLVFLDADAVVREYPVLFDTITEDIAVHYLDDVELLAGTMYFKNCDKVKGMVREWRAASLSSRNALAAQTGLADVLRTGKYTVYKLPAPYTLIFDRMKHQGPPVIEHFQASRKSRGRVRRCLK